MIDRLLRKRQPKRTAKTCMNELRMGLKLTDGRSFPAGTRARGTPQPYGPSVDRERLLDHFDETGELPILEPADVYEEPVEEVVPVPGEFVRSSMLPAESTVYMIIEFYPEAGPC